MIDRSTTAGRWALPAAAILTVVAGIAFWSSRAMRRVVDDPATP